MIVALSKDKCSLNSFYFGRKYIKYFKSFDLSLVTIPNNHEKVMKYFNEKIDALILTGGSDIEPLRYGEYVDWPDTCKVRDQIETILLDTAIQRKVPVLGICRGMQFINVYFGGKLVRNIQRNVGFHPFKEDHPVKVIDPEVKNFFGLDNLRVNSYHNQAVTKEVKAKPLNSFAEADFGIIEGLYHPTLPIAGIQWHPERESPDEEFNKKLILAFIKRDLFWKKN